jgi:hypothetical protein
LPPDEISSDDIIRPPDCSRRTPARWRRSLVLSLFLHVVGAGIAWWGFTYLVPALPVVAVVDTIIADEDVPIMDVDVRLTPPAPQPPEVIAPERVIEPARVAAAAPARPQASVPPVAADGGEPGGPAGSGNGTAGPATTFFAVPAQGRSIVYVIDRSGSMGQDSRLDLARREVLASLARLPESARFQIIAYNSYVEMPRGPRELLPATAENKERAARFLETLVAEGSTIHEKALDQALRLAPDVIYFLTDADDLKADEVRALTRLNRGRAAIHAIELNTTNRDRKDMPMHALPKLNRGQYQAVDVLQLR